LTTPSDPPPPPTPPPAPATYWDAPKDEVGPAPGVKFASHGPRLVAYIIDSLIVGLIYLVILVVWSAAFVSTTPSIDFDTGMPTGGMTAAVGLFGLFTVVFLFGLILPLAYFPVFWTRGGQTPGMRPFNLYVVRDSDGGPISTGQAILRLVGTWVAALPLYLGFVWVFIDARHRGWHDLIAGTVVIERPPRS
jgi:uncharacterized RDD family membrane protein YckC